MSGTIICPNCKTSFEPTEAFRDEVQRELNTKAKEWQAKKEEEFKQKEQSLAQQVKEKDAAFEVELKKQREALEKQLQETLRKTIANDYENQLKLLQQSNSENEEKLKAARRLELELLQKEQALKSAQNEMELKFQKQMMAEKESLKEQIKKEEAEKQTTKEQEYQYKLIELEKKLEDQKKLAEEMQRKAQQGSMQLQGEVQELALEQMLKSEFIYDEIQEIKKGEEGADAVQTVINDMRKNCGTILWESKRTKAWSDKWIEKLKEDMRNKKADLAVIISQALPKDMSKFGKRDGIWICSFADAKLVATMLRESLIKVSDTNKLLSNVSDKKEQLYKYMTSMEFKQKWEAIVGTYMNMQKQLTKEKVRTTKDWSEREKQLDIMLKNSVGFIGDVKGIGGLELDTEKFLEDVEEE